MSSYNSTNTKVLETHEQAGGNTRMLLAHECDSGRIEYVIGSYFKKTPSGRRLLFECHECGNLERGEELVDYEWDWGHYFSDIVEAVDYWKTEVLDIPLAKKMVIEDAWKRFGDTPIDDRDRIEELFWMKPGKSYPAGTSRFEILYDFDRLYADYGGVHALAAR